MERLQLHELHTKWGGQFTEVNGMEVVADYGDPLAEYAALTQNAGILDLSFRSRVCLTGHDRVRFLHGQVTNDVKKLRRGEGCYAALVTAKGRMQSDLNIYALADEFLLDFEPGLTQLVAGRLDQFIVADDVQAVDVSPHYGLLSVQGPHAEAVIRDLGLFKDVPSGAFNFVSQVDESLGELYLVAQPRLGSTGFDLFVPVAGLSGVAEKLHVVAGNVGGRPSGWQAMEIARIEAGIPRFGMDMDETNLPQECGIEARAISYSKGCYIGQEVLNRIHTMGHVNRELRGLQFAADLQLMPKSGDKLFNEQKEIGWLTSVVKSPKLKQIIALGYVRREFSQVGTKVALRTELCSFQAQIVGLPPGAGAIDNRG